MRKDHTHYIMGPKQDTKMGLSLHCWQYAHLSPLSRNQNPSSFNFGSIKLIYIQSKL